MGIYLGGRQTAVAKNLLDGVDVGPVVQHVRGKSVPQNMRTPLVDSGDRVQIFPYNIIYSLRIQFSIF